MLQGLRTAIYPVGDLAAAKAWYSKVTGHAPYFDQSFYVGFNVGGFELGLVPDGTPGTAGPQALWGLPTPPNRTHACSISAPKYWMKCRTWAMASGSRRCGIRSATG